MYKLQRFHNIFVMRVSVQLLFSPGLVAMHSVVIGYIHVINMNGAVYVLYCLVIN